MAQEEAGIDILFDAMKGYCESGASRFHMPGHKGISPFAGSDLSYNYDLTEISGLDSLYEASGPILEVEKKYAELYGSAGCVLSAGGATLCIQGMLAAALSPGDKLLCCRGAHVSAVRAMALLDIEPVWLKTDRDPETGLALPPSESEIENALEANPDIKAVYLTSPTYYGVICDIAAIAKVCENKNARLLTDNAHGAHLKFLTPDMHPIRLGAAYCADSLHKTLPVLTGGAVLHARDKNSAKIAREKMRLFGSTSPSYLILGSADLALDYLRENFAEDLAKVSAKIKKLKELACEKKLLLPGGQFTDPARLTLGTTGAGYTGDAFGEYLRGFNIEPEYAGGGWCVLMASPFNTETDWRRLESALIKLPIKPPLKPVSYAVSAAPEKAMGIREAVFAECETVPAAQAAGRIAGDIAAPCPPGIALIAPGEIITPEITAALTGYGVEAVRVVI